MELYIPPPMSYLPRVLPPRPVVPAVPLVPPPDLPDVLYAPEGAYTHAPEAFSNIGSPAHPTAAEMRAISAPPSSFLAGAGGFMANPGMIPGGPPAASPMSFGSSVVNGQSQPGWPTRMSFVNVWFPPKTGGNERSFGGLLGKGGKNDVGNTTLDSQQPPPDNGYEPSINSDDSSPSSDFVPPPLEIPFSNLPQQSGSKRIPFTKAQSSLNIIPRPKNNMRSSNSTFVTRIQVQDNLVKNLSEKGRNGGEMARWGFWNLGRTFAWGEEGGRTREPLTRITFSQVGTCHAVNLHTLGPDRVDVVVGFASGDLIWIDFTLGKYTRLNKGGLLNNTAVLGVHFDPRQPHHFIAHFADSTVLRFHLFAEDPAVTVMATPLPWNVHFDLEIAQRSAEALTISEDTLNGSGGKGQEGGEELIKWKNEEWGLLGNEREKKEKDRNVWAGKNPIAAWKIPKVDITAMRYAPDGRFLAVTAEDGRLRMIDVAEEQLTDTYAGYFGALNCVAWSPDSRFVAVGGQDDLITIYSARESRIVARCQGHSAFVTSIAFDTSRGEARAYRFASVGEDGKLILWDFSAAALHRPRHHHPNVSHHRLAAGGSSLSLANHGHGHSKSHLPLNSSGSGSIFHPAPPRSEVAHLQPVMARIVEGNLLTGVHMTPTSIVTVSRAAIVKFWQRPPRSHTASNRHKKPAPWAGTARERERSGRERDRESVAAA
ncbi:hypothetical protein I317_05912 [Kwoniella heveanensis CBS 569]|nr:hypothetical protein I317_05912 [Kwoniella heveanensis CBS 569]